MWRILKINYPLYLQVVVELAQPVGGDDVEVVEEVDVVPIRDTFFSEVTQALYQILIELIGSNFTLQFALFFILHILLGLVLELKIF